jgi:hypothetical protein
VNCADAAKRFSRKWAALFAALLVCVPIQLQAADSFAALCADRAAIERVYYSHRTGAKLPFEEVLPTAAIEKVVRADLNKQQVLKSVYNIRVADSEVEAEVKRMDLTTRAPEILAELKKALGNDPLRFARTVARPVVVERELRERFNNDTRLHAEARRQAALARDEILTARKTNAPVQALLEIMKHSDPESFAQRTWQLSGPPARNSKHQGLDVPAPAKSYGGAYALEGSVTSIQGAGAQAGDQLLFEDIPPELQKVLNAQLNKPGDVSAVIETPNGFLVCLATGRDDQRLSAAALRFAKRGFEAWLESVSETK